MLSSGLAYKLASSPIYIAIPYHRCPYTLNLHAIPLSSSTTSFKLGKLLGSCNLRTTNTTTSYCTKSSLSFNNNSWRAKIQLNHSRNLSTSNSLRIRQRRRFPTSCSSSRLPLQTSFFVPCVPIQATTLITTTGKLDSQIRNRSRRSSSHDHSDHDHDHEHDHSHSHGHEGHSHSHGLFGHHHHHHDNTFLTSRNKADAGVRITRIGLYVNVGMAISKGIGGWYFNSQALVADAVHALTDLVSDFMTLATVSWALKPPTEKFPNGFGKIESLGSLGVSGLLLFGGLAMCLNSCGHIYTQLFAEHAPHFIEHLHIGYSHSHSHSHTDLGPNINAAWLAGGSIIVKEWLYRATMKIAKARKSSVLASNAVHHRVDSLTAMVALVSISLSNLINNAAWLDPVGGLLVSLMVIHAGYGNSKSALMELADMAIDQDTVLDIERVAEDTLTARRLASVDGALSGKVAHVSGIKSGQNYLVEVIVNVEPGVTVSDTVGMEKALRESIGAEVRGVKRVKVKFVPEGTDTNEFVAKSDDEDLGIEDATAHDHDNEKKHTGKDH